MPSTTAAHEVSRSLLDTASYSRNDIDDLFSRADEFARADLSTGYFKSPRHRVLGFLFFEPSTRTRMSFQMAASRLGYDVLTLENTSSSSVSKGESLSDTVQNVIAMRPDALVIRYGQSPELDRLLPQISIPVINAGSGTKAHPTQALLDAYTIKKSLGSVEGRKVLIVGDIRHSRVAQSNFEVLRKLGAEVGVCGPREFIPLTGLPSQIKVFESLDEAVSWCDVFMGLRIQLERHCEAGLPEESAKSYSNYFESFGLTPARLKILKREALIMHPGPINHGVEFPTDESVMTDSRNRVLEQVSNGVVIRAAIIEKLFSGKDQ